MGTTPNALGSSTRVERDRHFGPALVVELHHRVEIEAREHVAVAYDEALVDTGGGEPDRAGSSERFVLDRIVESHVAERVVAGVVAEVRVERVGEVAHREHDLVDAVIGEPHELALEERLVHDGEQGLRGGVCQRPQP